MDISRDPGFRVLSKLGHQVFGVDGLPSYVKEYSPDEVKEASALADSDFADPATREYAITSKAATWLSAAYFAYTNPGVRDSCFNKIARAARVYGIESDVVRAVKTVEAFMMSVPENVKTASDDVPGHSPEIRAAIRRYPIGDRVGVEKAASYFDLVRRHYPREVRQALSAHIMRKAAAYGVDIDNLPPSLEREAGGGIPVRNEVMEAVNLRAGMAKSADHAMLLANVSRLISTVPEDGSILAVMEKVADVIHEFDLSEGLTQFYGNGLSTPDETVRTMSAKSAQDFVDNAVELGGHVFDIRKLAEFVEPGIVESVLGPDFVASVTSDDKARLCAGKLKQALAGVSISARNELGLALRESAA